MKTRIIFRLFCQTRRLFFHSLSMHWNHIIMTVNRKLTSVCCSVAFISRWPWATPNAKSLRFILFPSTHSTSLFRCSIVFPLPIQLFSNNTTGNSIRYSLRTVHTHSYSLASVIRSWLAFHQTNLFSFYIVNFICWSDDEKWQQQTRKKSEHRVEKLNGSFAHHSR